MSKLSIDEIQKVAKLARISLSDDEIDSCAYFTGMWCDGTPDDWDINTTRNFAKAILRKAQENE